MSIKALIPLVAGLGIGGLALVLGINTLKSAAAAGRPTAKVQIWGAKEDIPRGTQLTEDLLVALAYPADLVPKGAFKKQEELLGRVPRVLAPAGLPILESMLTEPGTQPGIIVKPGYRAVAVKIDPSSGVDYHLEPGCFVDVVGSFRVRRQGRTETVARTIVENAEVAAVGQRLSPATVAAGAGGNSTGQRGRSTTSGRGGGGSSGSNEQVRAVTLYVKPEQVPTLLLAEQQGRIKLSLRGYQEDQSRGPDHWVSEAELLGQAAEPDGQKAVAEARQRPTEGPGSDASSPWGWLSKLFAARPTAAGSGAAEGSADAAAQLSRWILRIYRGNEEEVVEFAGVDSHERVGWTRLPTKSSAAHLTAGQPSNGFSPAKDSGASGPAELDRRSGAPYPQDDNEPEESPG